MSKTKSAAEKMPSGSYELRHIAVNYYLFIMFTVFPLFVNMYTDARFPFIHFENGYIGIRHEKYYFFLAMSVLLIIAEILVLLTSADTGAKKSSLAFKDRLRESLNLTDWAALAFLFVCAVSTLFSKYPSLAFWGEMSVGGSAVGRNNGLMLMGLYVTIYFIISRNFRRKEFVFRSMAVCCSIVYLLAVLNAFYIDPLHMFDIFMTRGDGESIIINFTSTIGNKNMLSSFICVTQPVFVTLAVHFDDKLNRIIYTAASALGFTGLMMADSDSGLLGMGAFAAVFCVVYCRRLTKLKRYFFVWTIMLISTKVLRGFSSFLGDNYKELGPLIHTLVFSEKMYFVIVAFAGVTAILYSLDKQMPAMKIPKAVPVTVAACFGFFVVFGFGAMIYFTNLDKTTDLGALSRFLRFNESWGTHRGIMWLRTFDIFADASIFNKLFGTGPDTFYHAFSPYFEELKQYGDTSTDAAHNEYLNYLITVGIFGAGAYLTFAFSALAGAFKSAKKNPFALTYAAAVIGYLAQAVVNIALPIGTPILIIFLALCRASVAAEKQSAL